MYVDWSRDVDHKKPDFYSNPDLKTLQPENHVSFEEKPIGSVL